MALASMLTHAPVRVVTAAYPIWSTLVGTLTVIVGICVYAAFTYRTHSRRPDSLTDHRDAVRGVYDQDQP